MVPLREMVLYYNPDQSPYASKLKGVLVRMGIRIKNIAPEQTGELVGTLAGMPGYAEGEELWKQAIAQKKSQKADEGAGQFRGRPNCSFTSSARAFTMSGTVSIHIEVSASF